MALWGLSVVFGKMTDTPNMLHLTVILFHEAGHVIFTPFGEALRVAGGTLGQLLMPLICAVALHRRDDNFLFDRYGQLDHARGWARLMKALGAIGLLRRWLGGRCCCIYRVRIWLGSEASAAAHIGQGVAWRSDRFPARTRIPAVASIICHRWSSRCVCIALWRYRRYRLRHLLAN